MEVKTVWDYYFAGEHDKVLTAGATAVETMHITGLSLAALGRIEEAETLLMASTLVQPRQDWFCNACVAFLERGEPNRALPFALTGLKEFPDSNDIHFNAASVMTALNRHAEAREHLTKVTLRDPTNYDALLNLGNALRRLGNLHEALAAYDRALALNTHDLPTMIRTRLNKAVTLSDLGQEELALSIFDNLASTLKVKSPEMDFNRATLRLKLGDYETGWPMYASRWDCPMAKADVAAFSRPMLESLEQAKGKHILISHEQGFGDSIQFVRYAPMLAALAGETTLLVPMPLVRLFVSLGIPIALSREGLDYDYECPMLNLPALFGTTVATIPGTIPYLSVPPDLIEARKVPSTRRLKVGLVWAGQARDSTEMRIVDERRSIPLLAFSEILERDIDFYSLQFGERAADLTKLPEVFRPKQVLRPDDDFLDTAAVIKNLDLVISVDTATAHLAGALGAPVWMLSRFDGCWRWLKDREDTPWYSPNMRIFNQEERGHWTPTLHRVGSALDDLIG